MAYNTDILDRQDELADSQPDLLGNFAELALLLQQDHVNFNLADAGKHKQLTMPQQVVAAVPTPSATEYGMFNGQINLDGRTFANILAFQASGVLASSAVAGSFSTAQYDSRFFEEQSMRLPSGILIKWAFHPDYQISSPTNDAIMAFTWKRTNNTEPFTTQYWAYISPISIVPQWEVTTALLGNASGNTDNPAVFTVYDVSDPTKVKFLSFDRTPPFLFFPDAITKYTGGIFVLAIGV